MYFILFVFSKYNNNRTKKVASHESPYWGLNLLCLGHQSNPLPLSYKTMSMKEWELIIIAFIVLADWLPLLLVLNFFPAFFYLFYRFLKWIFFFHMRNFLSIFSQKIVMSPKKPCAPPKKAYAPPVGRGPHLGKHCSRPTRNITSLDKKVEIVGGTNKG